MPQRYITASLEDGSSKSLKINNIELLTPTLNKDFSILQIKVSSVDYEYKEVLDYFNTIDKSKISYAYKTPAVPSEYMANDVETLIKTYEGYSADIDTSYEYGLYIIRLYKETDESLKASAEYENALSNLTGIVDLYSNI